MTAVVFWLIINTGTGLLHVGTFSTVDLCKAAGSNSWGLFVHQGTGAPGWFQGENLNNLAWYCVAANDSATKPPGQ
jgi:hypothetical protein